MKIVVASGKGGTGKTTVSLGLSSVLADRLHYKTQLIDADVEAPNDHLYFSLPAAAERFPVKVSRPIWQETLCQHCGQCVANCQFNAIAKLKKQVMIFDELCHSCNACIELCPHRAFISKPVEIGTIHSWTLSDHLKLAQGELNVGESLAPKIIRTLKERFQAAEVTIIDASPGTTCPVVEAMRDADYCILVTEPTPYGLHDLQLTVELTRQLEIPTAVVINRSYGNDQLIENWLKQVDLPILLKIAFSREYAAASAQGTILAKKFSELAEGFVSLFENLPLQARIAKQYIAPQSSQFFPIDSIISAESNERSPHQLVVISGKGGTGKTTLSTALSYLLPSLSLADADVDAANFNLVGISQQIKRDEFIGGKKYRINQEQCTQCGLCVDRCAYRAINSSQSVLIDSSRCEGCGLCAKLCPTHAIEDYPAITGEHMISRTERGFLSHAKLAVGEENSGKLVKKVREVALELAQVDLSSTVLIDGPPGTGCPVISSISGVNRALIVTEPSLSGLHDMQRAINLCRHFSIKYWVVINKADLSPELTASIISQVEQNGGEVMAQIPFDPSVYVALMEGKSVVHQDNSPVKQCVQFIAKKIEEEL